MGTEGLITNDEFTDDELENPYKQALLKGQDTKVLREKELLARIVDSTFDDLSDKCKKLFYEVYESTEQGLKVFISDFVTKACPSLNGTYDDSNKSESQRLKEQNYKFQNSCNIQRNRWKDKVQISLNKKDNFIKRTYKHKYSNDMTFEEFLIKGETLLNNWYHTEYQMIEFPFFYSFTSNKSKKSGIRYDIGRVALTVCNKILNTDYVIYKQIDYFATTAVFKKSTRRKPKVNIISEEDELYLTNGSSHFEEEIQEQISLTALIDENMTKEQTRFIEKASKNFAKYQDSPEWNDILKDYAPFVKNYDEVDQELFSYILSQISNSFYIDRKIKFAEKDALIALQKDHTSGKNKIWLRNRLKKLKVKELKVLSSTTNQIIDSCATLFQDVQFGIGTNEQKLYQYKQVIVVASEELYMKILEEDTIKVYRNDFISVKDSSKPYCTLLLYPLQLLRVRLHGINSTVQKLTTEFFENKLGIYTSIDRVSTIQEIRECLNIYKNKKTLVKNFSYDEQFDLWTIEFYNFKKHDANLLINQRKDYKNLVMKGVPPLEIAGAKSKKG